MSASDNSKVIPSTRWSSSDGWNYKGMKERLDGFLAKLDTSVLVRHAEQVLQQTVTLSDPFSAGQY
jgi:hypothetical protein